MKTKTILMIASLSLWVNAVRSQCTSPTNAVIPTDYIGTSNALPLMIKVNNVASGLIDNGTQNVLFGYSAGLLNTTGNNLTGIGSAALIQNTTGIQNTALGSNTLFANKTASNNTAIGYFALNLNLADEITAVGSGALRNNSTGIWNNAIGYNSLELNNTGSSNTGLGYRALSANTTGSENTAVGARAQLVNTGSQNTSLGSLALGGNTAGNQNTAIGANSLTLNSTGLGLTAIGYQTGLLNFTGSNNTYIGALASCGSTNLLNATAIGNGAIVNSNNRVVVGNTAAGIVIGGFANWSNLSDGRFKENVQENVPGLDFITQLRPVTYNFNVKKLDEHAMQNMTEAEKAERLLGKDYEAASKKTQTGFIAQEVEKTAKELGFDFDGVNAPQNESDNYSIAYSQFIMPLVKAVQEQQAMIEEQKKLIFDLQAQMSSSASLKQTDNKEAVSMDQNIPNPFVDATDIKYDIPSAIQKATLIVYDLTGKQLQSFPLEKRGKASITISSEQFVAGIYIYAITADGKILESKKMMVSEK